MVKLSEVIDAVYNAECRVTELSALRNEVDTLKAEIATLRGKLAVAEDKAQLYWDLYDREMKRQAKEIRQ